MEKRSAYEYGFINGYEALVKEARNYSRVISKLKNEAARAKGFEMNPAAAKKNLLIDAPPKSSKYYNNAIRGAEIAKKKGVQTGFEHPQAFSTVPQKEWSNQTAKTLGNVASGAGAMGAASGGVAATILAAQAAKKLRRKLRGK